MVLKPDIWLPRFQFIMQTISINYPIQPNDVTKKKYYDFIQNLPLFLPIENVGNNFSKMLDKYPVTPYLEGRESFIKWMHFIHNKINVELGVPEVTTEEAMSSYYSHYKPKAVTNLEEKKRREKIIYLVIILFILAVGIYLYSK